MTNFLQTLRFFDLLRGKEILLVLQHLVKLPSPKAHHALTYYSSQNFPSTRDEEFLFLLRASRSASKNENSDCYKYSCPYLYWKEEYLVHCKFCFADRKPFDLISFSFLNLFLRSRTRHNQYSSR